MALQGNLQIGAPSSISTPPSGEVTEFFNSEFSPARLYYKDSDGNSFPVNQDAEDCCCEIAENMIKKIACGVSEGVISMSDLNAFILQGVVISGESTDDGSGNKTCSVTITKAPD